MPRRKCLPLISMIGLLAPIISGLQAAEYQSKQPIPDSVLRDNIEALATYVLEGAGESGEVDVRVTRIIGREALVDGQQRVWFCLETTRNGQTTKGCGADVRLIQLDSGRWIIQDLGRDAWLLVRDDRPR